jgi:DNA-directed RNA polymerase subunit M/transcription elongation factor TFIIS
MPIAVACQCGKTLNVRDELAGKAVKCPACQQILKVPAAGKPATGKPPTTANTNAPKAPTPRTPTPKTPTPRPAAASAAAASSSLDSLFEESGFAVKTGKFCPECAQLLLPGAVLCTHCGYHLESGSKLQGHRVSFEDPDSGEAALRRAEANIKRDREAQERMQAAGMPPWVMAMILFILSSCTAVAVAAVNVAQRGKDDTTTFNATATMLLLAGIAFTAVAIGASCTVLYRAFKSSPKEGMFVLLIPGYGFYYAATHFRAVGKPFITCLITAIIGATLIVLAGMSNEGKL